MTTTRTRLPAALLAAVGLLSGRAAAEEVAPPKPADVKAIAVHPAKVTLKGSDDAAQLVVTATLADGRLQHLTTDSTFSRSDGKTESLSSAGGSPPGRPGAATRTRSSRGSLSLRSTASCPATVSSSLPSTPTTPTAPPRTSPAGPSTRATTARSPAWTRTASSGRSG